MKVCQSLILPLVVLVGCVDRDVIAHEMPSDAGESALQPREGNFPEPATSMCGSLPAAVTPIAELATSWMVTAPGTTGRRLRISNEGLGCAEAFVLADPPTGNCDESWSWWYGLTLPVEIDGPGIYELDQVAGLYPEISMTDNACGGDVGGGGGEPGEFAGPGAELEIFAMTETCIIGELRGLHFGVYHPELELSGGFVAQRCETSCATLEATGPEC
jgi:hypothetical protein